MEEEKKKAYSEVVEILKLIEDEKKIESIPFDVIELIKNKSDLTYKPQISKDIPIEQQNLRDETYAILGWIANKYWNQDIIESKENDITEEKEEEEKEKETKSDEVINVYNDIEPEILEKDPQSILPIAIEELKWYEKIKIKMIKFLHIIFKFNNSKGKEGVF